MPDYLITNCTVKDGAEMARNNMSAFWGDPNWRYVWKHSTLPRVIEVATPRMPNNLLKNQEALRHFKAVDPETGRLLGYIRWMLPENHYYYDNDNDDKDRMEPVEGGLVPHDVTRRSPVWPEGQIPAVSDEERAEIAAGAAAVLWDPNVTNTDDRLDDILGVIKDRLMSKKEYLRMCLHNIYHDPTFLNSSFFIFNPFFLTLKPLF